MQTNASSSKLPRELECRIVRLALNLAEPGESATSSRNRAFESTSLVSHGWYRISQSSYLSRIILRRREAVVPIVSRIKSLGKSGVGARVNRLTLEPFDPSVMVVESVIFAPSKLLRCIASLKSLETLVLGSLLNLDLADLIPVSDTLITLKMYCCSIKLSSIALPDDGATPPADHDATSAFRLLFPRLQNLSITAVKIADQSNAPLSQLCNPLSLPRLRALSYRFNDTKLTSHLLENFPNLSSLSIASSSFSHPRLSSFNKQDYHVANLGGITFLSCFAKDLLMTDDIFSVALVGMLPPRLSFLRLVDLGMLLGEGVEAELQRLLGLLGGDSQFSTSLEGIWIPDQWRELGGLKAFEEVCRDRGIKITFDDSARGASEDLQLEQEFWAIAKEIGTKYRKQV